MPVPGPGTDTFVSVLDSTSTTFKMDVSQTTVSGQTVNRQRIVLADGLGDHNLCSVAQFHLLDNLNFASNVYQLFVASLQLGLDVNGNFDRIKTAQGDQLPATGVGAAMPYLARYYPPTTSSSNLTAGANKVILVPSTANIFVGSLVKVDSGANAEWARVNALVANTSITVDNLNIAHNGSVTNFLIVPVLFDQAKDAAGTMDLADSTGMVPAVEYNFDGTTAQRQRNAFGLNTYTDTSPSNVSASTNPVTIATTGTPPSTLQVGAPILIDALGTNPELTQVIAVNSGGKTITVASLAFAHNGSVTAFQIAAPYQGMIQVPANFGAFGLGAIVGTVYSGTSATTGLVQYSAVKDINAAGLTPTWNTSAVAGVLPHLAYGIYVTTLPTLTNNKISALITDVSGRLLIGSDVASGATDAGNPIKIGGLFTTSVVTLANNQRGNLLLGAGGEVIESTGGRFAVNQSAGVQNTVVKNGAGRLCRILTAATGTAGTTIYDNATAGATTGNILAVIPANDPAGTIRDYQIPCTTGISVVGVANSPQLTITYE